MQTHQKLKYGGPLLLVLKMSRVVGVAPLSFGPDGIRFSKPYYVYSMILMTVLQTTILTGFYIDMRHPEESVRVLSLTATVCWVCNLTAITAVAVHAGLGARKRCACALDVLDRIYEVRARVGNNKENLPETRLYALIRLFVVALCTIFSIDLAVFIIVAIRTDKNVKTILMFSLFYFDYCVEFLVALQFLLLMLHLRLALKDINNDLQNLLHTLETEASFDIAARHTVRQLLSAHESVCDALRDTTREHGAMLLLLLQSFFMHSVITPYNLIALYSASSSILLLGLQVGWFSLHASNVALVAEPCHLMQREMERTRELVSQLLRQAGTPLCRELHVFYEVLMLDRPAVSPLGLCVLGRPLVVAILGAVTTYLVIILQFRASDEQREN